MHVELKLTLVEPIWLMFNLHCYFVASHHPTWVETRSGHLGQLGHVLSRSSGPDPVNKISRSDPDSALNHM